MTCRKEVRLICRHALEALHMLCVEVLLVASWAHCWAMSLEMGESADRMLYRLLVVMWSSGLLLVPAFLG